MSGAGLPAADDVFGHSDAGLPHADQAFGPEEPVKSGPAQDGFFSAAENTASHVLNAFGQGAESGWGDTPHVLSPDAEKWLQKAGTFNDYKNGRTSIIKGANEALMRPAAAALDVILHPIATAEAAMSAVGAATQQVGTELQGAAKHLPPGAATIVGGTGEILQSVPEGFGLEFPLRPFTPADFAKAKNLKVIGAGEAGYFGTKEATPAEGLQAAIKQIRDEEGHLEPGAGEAVTPEEKARAAGGTPPQAELPDIHSVAREIAPDTFKTYDALAAERETYRRQINALSEARTETPEAQAAQSRIDDILGKVRGVEDRLTKSAANRLDTAWEELDDALHRDTAEMQKVRQSLLATDFRMRDLAPQVAQAYREAQARLPQPEAPAPVAAPEPESPPQQQVIPPTAAITETAPPNVAGEEKIGAAKHPPVDIASDVAGKLVSAGRPQEEAKAAAAIVQAHYEARAARFEGKKGTASDLYRKDAPEIRGAGIRKRALEMAQGRTLHQEPIIPEPPVNPANGKPITTKPLADDLAIIRQLGRDGDVQSLRDAAEYHGTKGPTGSGIEPSPVAAQYARDVLAALGNREFKTEPGAVDAEGNPLPQTIIPGAEGGARQLAAAREAQGKGLKFTRKGQKEAGGLFEGEKPEDEQGTLFQSAATKPTFYSALTRGIEDIPTERAPASQWEATINNRPSIKEEEVKWSGVREWLAQQKGPVSKADLLEFLRENEVNVREVERSDSPSQLRLERAEQALVDHLVKNEHFDEAGARRYALDAARGDLSSGQLRLQSPESRDLAHELQEAYETRQAGGGARRTKFGQYTLPGGENYRELLLTLPAKSRYDVRNAEGRYRIYDNQLQDWKRTPDGKLWIGYDNENAARQAANGLERTSGSNPGGNFISSHFDEPNILAHIRFDDRTGPNGEKVLHIAEVQSDWHQKGRREGYTEELSPNPPGWAVAGDASVRGKGVPDAPFKQSWQELSMKRMLRYAAEHGYEKLTWDTGETQAERYDLSKQIKSVRYEKAGTGGFSSLDSIENTNKGHGRLIAVDHSGREVIDKYIRDENELPEIVGKDVADKLLNTKPEHRVSSGMAMSVRELSGLDLKVGGEGMRGFYDKILPSFLNKYAKKWGAKVSDTSISADKEGWHLTPPDQTVSGKWMVKSSDYNSKGLQFDTEAEAKAALAERVKSQPVHSISITPAMRDSVMEGQALFQGRRGSITVGESRNVIKLFKDADASTFMHETAHHWLEELRADAADPQAPSDLVKDAQTVHDWLGAKPDVKLTRAQHEKFARGFERYLMEGVAPSRALANIFAKFREWLTQIYQTATRLRSPINDDIRGVFDRLIAAKPEPAVIAPERSIEAHLADIHEAEAEHTPPERAAPVAEHIRSEVNSVAKEKTPDVHAGLPANEAGGIESPNAPFAGGADEAGPIGRAEGNAQTSGTEYTSRDETPRKGVGRGEYEAALGAIRHWKSPLTKPTSLFDEIRSLGGLKVTKNHGDIPAAIADLPDTRRVVYARDAQGHQIKSHAKFKNGIINNESGKSADALRESLKESGWFGRMEYNTGTGEQPGDLLSDLADLIDREARGEPVYHPEDEVALEVQHRRAFEEELDAAGIGHSDPPEWAAHKLAVWRATEEAAQFAREQEEKAYEELSRLEPADHEELVSHGYEPGSDIAAEHEPAGPEHIGDSGELGEREAFEPKVTAPSARAAATGAESEHSTGPNERFPESESRLVDKAGNIRLDNVNSEEDIKSLLREVADQNGGFLQQRRNVLYDAQVLSLAEEMGVSPAELNDRKIGRAYNAEEIKVLENALAQSTMAVRDAMITAADSKSPADLMALAAAKARQRMIQGQFSGATAEAGRALRALRKTQQFWKEGDKELQQYLQTATGQSLEELYQEAKFGAALKTRAQLANYLNDSNRKGFRAAAQEYWVNTLISGPVTHFRYAVGNAINALWRPLIELPIAAGIGATRELLGYAKDGDRVYLGEAGAELFALIKGSRDGWGAATEAFKLGASPLLPGERGEMFVPTKAIPGLVGEAVRVPGRGVAAIHSFFKSLRYEQNIQGLAYRQAAKDGLEGNAFTNRVADLTVHPTEDMMHDATADALKELYMAPTRYNTFSGFLIRASNSNIVAKILVPFMKIGTQITRNAYIERTPVGLIDREVRGNLLGESGGANQDLQSAKIVAGMSLMGITVGLAAEGLATGDGPTDPRQRSIWLLHHRPNTVQIGDISIPYRGLGSLGMLMRFGANMYQTASGLDGTTTDKVAFSVLQGFTKSVLDENFMRGVQEALDAVYHPEEYGGKYLENFATSWMPYSVGMSQIAREIDPDWREAHGLLESAMEKAPWLSERLEPRIDIFGQPIPSGSVNPAYFNDPALKALESVGYFPGRLQRHIRGVDLTEHQYTQYAIAAGTTTKMRLDTLVSMPGFSALPVGVRQEMIKEAITSSRENARSLIMMQYPDIMQKATEAKAAALQ